MHEWFVEWEGLGWGEAYIRCRETGATCACVHVHVRVMRALTQASTVAARPQSEEVGLGTELQNEDSNYMNELRVFILMPIAGAVLLLILLVSPLTLIDCTRSLMLRQYNKAGQRRSTN